jgi:hypothetical protein
LRVIRILEDEGPCQVISIEVASENSDRLYSTALNVVVRIAHHMAPQGLEDCLSSTVSEFAILAGWAVAVTYM